MAALNALLDWLYLQQERGVHPGLGRVRQLLGLLGDPQDSFRSVQVGGTNGKGSTTRMLSTILRAAGWGPVGEYTSPHLHRFSERLQVDGREVGDEELADLLATLRHLHMTVPATFFEIVTAAALEHFRRSGVRWAVLEVGMGGRLDATTAASIELAVITGVSLDHTAILGGTVEEIASEKAGIIRPSVPVVTGAAGAALAEIERRAREMGAPLWVLGREVVLASRTVPDGQEVVVETPAGRASGPVQLRGAHQARNAALAAAAALALGAPPEAVGEGLAATRWPGRLDLVPGQPDVLVDAAHNPEGAAALASHVRDEHPERYVTLVVAGLADKDLGGVAAELAPLASLVIATRPRTAGRAASPEAVAAHYPGALSAPDPAAALAMARERTPAGGLVVVAGTIPLAAEALEVLRGTSGEGRTRLQ
ncbi:MAG TPA: folylpolyglutamate synthase/dihydrofolate synthase family protein [Deinococcales bacterium]|nr:folylpolyglutamate synthase/dihydrofolate synthase family protein [Deinococcales bacterium]